MDSAFYNEFTDEQKVLFDEIENRCVDEMNLAVTEHDNFIGFKGENGFCLFWVTFKYNSVKFISRRRYSSSKANNRNSIPFLVENKDEITQAINAIYAEYLAYINSPEEYLLKTEELRKKSRAEKASREEAPPSTEDDIALQQEIARLIDELDVALKKLKIYIDEHGDDSIANITMPSRKLKQLFTDLNFNHISNIVAVDAKQFALLLENSRYHLSKLTNMVKVMSVSGAQLPNTEKAVPSFSNGLFPANAVFFEELTGDKLKEFSIEAMHLSRTSSADAFSDRISNILDTIWAELSKAKEFFDYMVEYNTQDVTLESIGQKISISRERVRQKINKSKKAFAFGIKRYQYPFFTECKTALTNEINALSKADRLPFMLYALTKLGKRSAHFTCELFFSEELYNLSRDLANFEMQLSKSVDSWYDKIKKKVCYPSTAIAKGIPSSYPNEMDIGYVKNIENKLEQNKNFIDFVVSPDIVYHTTKDTDHRPNFWIRDKKTGNAFLVVMTSVAKLAVKYNLNRFNSLHSFCKLNGYGYLILDDRMRSIYDYKKAELDKETVAELDAILNSRGVILSNDIDELKQHHHINVDFIISYIMQNKLDYSNFPFYIKRKNED